MASILLPKAQIIRVADDKISVAHPELETNIRTYLTASIAAAGTALTVQDNDGFADNDFMIIGHPGDSKTEEIDVNGSVTRGASLTVTNTLKFSHDIDAPATLVYARKIRIQSAPTLTGSQTEVTGSPFFIQWDKPFTECVVTLGATNDDAFYFAKFTDAAGSPVFSEEDSNGVASSGLGETMAERIIQNALRLTNEKINTALTREDLLEELNNWQDDVASRRDWAFETKDSTITSGVGESEYTIMSDLKHPNSNKGMISVKFKKDYLTWVDWHEYTRRTENQVTSLLNGATTAGDTSVTLDDSTDFNSTGSFSIETDLGVIYTANNGTVLSGIPASGAGSLASNHSDNVRVWQGVAFGKPQFYTVYNDKFIVDVPVHNDHDTAKFRTRYYQIMTRLTDLTDTTIVAFHYTGQYFVAARIEYRKGNHDLGNKWMALYEGKLNLETRKDRLPTIQRWTPQGDDTFSSIQNRRGKFYKSTESSIYN